MSSFTTSRKHSITLPEKTSSGVQERVGTRGFSAYIAEAVDRQLERDALADTLADMEAKNGPVSEEAVAAVLEHFSS
jgi:hypothetical protein